MFILAETEIGNVFPREQIWGCIFFLQLWVETVNVFIHCILNIFYQQYCILIHNQETKIPKKEFFTSNFEGNAQQLAGLSPGDSKARVMENSERLFGNPPKVYFRLSCMIQNMLLIYIKYCIYLNKDISWKPFGQPWCPQMTKCLCLYFQWQRSIPISE